MGSRITDAFTNYEIVPHVLSSSPEKLLQVRYLKSGKDVNLGNEIIPGEDKEKPDINYEADSDDYYTLILTDPDAPSKKLPIRGEFRQWLVVNIPGSDVSKGEELTAYVRSCPLKGFGVHRYIFLLYKQPKKLFFDSEETLAARHDRAKFSAEKFREKYNLELIAGNFYQAQFDDSAPPLR